MLWTKKLFFVIMIIEDFGWLHKGQSETEDKKRYTVKIAFVDDEKEYAAEMERICLEFGAQNHCQIETVSFTGAAAFLAAFPAGGFDMVFMDIYMDGMDGVSAAVRMREADKSCLLVFLTSSTEFMPEAFSCHAFEYVTKPFSGERIADVLRDALKVLPDAAKYIAIQSDRKTVPVAFGSIVYAVTDAHYLEIGLTDGSALRSRMTLSEFLAQVEGDARFIAINKGIVINADCIMTFENNCCVLEDGTQFPVKVREFLKMEQMVREYHFKKIHERQALAAGRRAKGELTVDQLSADSKK